MKGFQFGIIVFLLCILVLAHTPYNNPAGMVFALMGGFGFAHAIHSWLVENKRAWIWLFKEKH